MDALVGIISLLFVFINTWKFDSGMVKNNWRLIKKKKYNVVKPTEYTLQHS